MDNNPLWNRKALPQPPVNTYKSSSEDLDLIKFRYALQDGIKHFKDQFLTSEATLLARILYRMKMKFRNAKDFKLIETLSRSLNIYFNTNLSSHLKRILDVTPLKYGVEAYLPSRNMLSFILVKLQGIVKLLEKIYETSQTIAIQIVQRLYIGHFWKVFLILFGLVSRISVLVKFNTKFFCELYGKLYPHLNKLENVGQNWLPNDYEFPVDLQSWLGVKWVYEDIYVDLTFDETNEIMTFFNLVDDEDDDVLFCDEYIVVDDEDKNTKKDTNGLSLVKELLARNRMRGFSINEDDIGEEIIDINDSIKSIDSVKESIEDFGEEIICLTNNSEMEFDSGQGMIDESLETIVLDDTITNQVYKGKRKSEKFNKSNNKKKRKAKSQISESPKKKGKNKIEKENQDSSVILLDSESPDILLIDSPKNAKSTLNLKRDKKHFNLESFLSKRKVTLKMMTEDDRRQSKWKRLNNLKHDFPKIFE